MWVSGGAKNRYLCRASTLPRAHDWPQGQRAFKGPGTVHPATLTGLLKRRHGRTCPRDKKGEYAGSGFYFVQGQEAFQCQVQDRLDSTSTKGHIASARNANAEVGAITEEATESRNQTATQDLQSIVSQVGN